MCIQKLVVFTIDADTFCLPNSYHVLSLLFDRMKKEFVAICTHKKLQKDSLYTVAPSNTILCIHIEEKSNTMML